MLFGNLVEKTHERLPELSDFQIISRFADDLEI